jgi:hypothetical protein
MGIIGKNIKRGIFLGGMVGALVGSQYGSASKAYQEVLKTDKNEKELVIKTVKKNRVHYLDKATYKLILDGAKDEYLAADSALDSYNSLSSDEKRKEARSDIGNYGLTLKEMKSGGFKLPTSSEAIGKTGKGAGYGA